MFTGKLHEKISASVKWLQRFVDRIWYPPLIGFLALLDNLVVVVPTDGILVSSSMLKPKRWALFALSIAVGSTLGALLLAMLVEHQGLPWILQLYPGIDQTQTWAWADEWFGKYGLVLVFAVAATPLMQQPTVILASLAGTPLVELAIVIFTGRFIKFLFMAYLGSHAPRYLSKLWGIRDELKDAGVNVR